MHLSILHIETRAINLMARFVLRRHIMDRQTIDAVQVAIDRCFQMNAMADAVYYALATDFADKHAEEFHHEQAHAFPKIADDLGNILIGRGIKPRRGDVAAQNQSWTTPAAALAEYRDAVFGTEQIIGDAYYKAHDKSDAGVAAQLADILDDFAKDMVAKAVAIAKHAEIEEREHGRIMMAM